MASLTLELNIALIPEEQLAQEFPALVQLGGENEKLAITPHLTLYQVPITIDKIHMLDNSLTTLMQKFTSQQLSSTRYVYNEDEASFEIQYEVAGWLLDMQEQLIAIVNPQRNGLLLERDPAGHNVSELLSGENRVNDNIRQTGYAEVGNPRNGGLFRPHVTLNWFVQGTKIAISDKRLPVATTLNGKFIALGVFFLGPFGTCPQRLSIYYIQ
jgi:hypothetical protein